jgi:hypothetical protein
VAATQRRTEGRFILTAQDSQLARTGGCDPQGIANPPALTATAGEALVLGGLRNVSHGSSAQRYARD